MAKLTKIQRSALNTVLSSLERAQRYIMDEHIAVARKGTFVPQRRCTMRVQTAVPSTNSINR